MGSWIEKYQCAKLLSVSSATVRNWIKAGYLNSNEDGRVSSESIDRVKSEVIGGIKLTSRANKLFKINDGDEYNESRRNRDGIYYTPQFIVDDMLSTIDLSQVDLSRATFLDPCCGDGNFLVTALQLGFLPQNIYGYDIDPKAVNAAKDRIMNASGYVGETTILCGDFLTIAHDRKYDFIYTNPPWGKKLQPQESGRKIDSSEQFFRRSMEVLRDGGRIGFLMQEAVFNVGTYQQFREFIFSYNIVKFSHYGQSFKGLLTAAQAVIVDKFASENSPIICCDGNSIYMRSCESFANNPYLIFNFQIKPNYADLIAYILKSDDYITLKARWGLGIVTGNNSRFCSREPRATYQPIFRGEDISIDGLAEPSLYITTDLSKCQQVAPLETYYAPSKIIYKFISSRLIFYLDREQRLILNSANMLLLDSSFPLSEEQLVALFNSPFMNWLYTSIFSARKVLKRDLERLPIFINNLSKGEIFNESTYLQSLGIEPDGVGGYRFSNS
ncbi:MAG: TaqI-like C-terminal specificity domain-containing protein [Rikenellaceae bacterium]